MRTLTYNVAISLYTSIFNIIQLVFIVKFILENQILNVFNILQS